MEPFPGKKNIFNNKLRASAGCRIKLLGEGSKYPRDNYPRQGLGGGNSPGVIVERRDCLEDDFPWVISLARSCLKVNCSVSIYPSLELSGGNCPGGNCLKWELPGGNYPVFLPAIYSSVNRL